MKIQYLKTVRSVSEPYFSLRLSATPKVKSEGEKQGQYEYHDDTHNDLQWQTDFDVIHESVLSGRHDQCIGRRGERRGKTHTGSDGYRKKERIWAGSDLYCRLQGYGSQKYGRGGIADKHGQ